MTRRPTRDIVPPSWFARARPWLIGACLIGAVLLIVFTEGCRHG